MPIFESWPWKAKIAKYADSLERLRSGTEEYDDDQWWADFEEAVMAGAFAIRKLFESKKLSYEAQAITIDCKNSPKIPAPLLENGVSLKPSFMDRDKLDRYFDVAVQAQTKVYVPVLD